MAQRLLIAIAAGLAAALLFIVPMKGGFLAMLIAVLAAMPIMIAGLGFGQLASIIAVVAGAMAVAAYLHPIFGGVFAFSLGLPAWRLAALASLCRPVAPDSTDVVWYPIDRLLGWIVGLSAATTLVLFGLAVARTGGYDEFVTLLTGRLSPVRGEIFGTLPGGMSNDDMARMLVYSMPPIMAGWSVVTLALNFWLAARVVLISGMLARPWQPLPDHLVLPPVMRPVFAAALAACVIDGPVRLVGMVCAAAIAVGYMFEGFAAIHFLTRKSNARTAILSGVYASILMLMPWPLIIAALLGLADSFWPFRRAANAVAPAKPRNPTTTQE